MFLCWPQTHSCGWKKNHGAWLPGGLHVDEPSQVHVGLLQFVQQDSPFSVQVLSGQGQTVAGGMWWCCSATKYATSFVQHRRVGKAAWSPARTWRHVVFSHVTPNVSSHLHWLFNGLVPFYLILSRSDPLMIQPSFFSGVDIGDEHLIPGYIWMFSISFNIQWSVRWFVEETIAGLVKIIMSTSFGNDRHVPMNFAGERGLPWFLVNTWACTASRICDHLQFGYVLHPNSARFSTQDREARERLVRECYAHHGASQVGCCCGLCHSVARGNWSHLCQANKVQGALPRRWWWLHGTHCGAIRETSAW